MKIRDEIFIRLMVGIIFSSVVFVIIFLFLIIIRGSIKEVFEIILSNIERVVSILILSSIIIAIFAEKSDE